MVAYPVFLFLWSLNTKGPVMRRTTEPFVFNARGGLSAVLTVSC